MRFIAFDLETTGVDVETAEVVQAAVVEASLRVTMHGYSLTIGEATTQLFHVASIPEGATAVHGIRAEDVADKPPFVHAVRSLVKGLTEPEVVAVSFNGCAYDIPIIARYAARFAEFSGGRSDTFLQTDSTTRARPVVEDLLRRRHIDVMRLWWRVKQSPASAPWQERLHDTAQGWWPTLTSDMFAGSLAAVHGFFKGEGFGGAHDAGNDCRATLAVLGEMLNSGMSIDDAIRWSNEPLPGDVDFAGKFKWQGDRVVIMFGKHSGTLIEDAEVSYLRWMLGKDFPSDTKNIVRRFLADEYPQRSET
jgi:hypothetical protein